MTSRRWPGKLQSYPEEREENRVKSNTRSRVEHVFALLNLKFGFAKLRYRGLAWPKPSTGSSPASP